MRAIALAATACSLSACDESLAVHDLDPRFNRMLDQARVDPYDPSTLFDDGLAMRRPPHGAIPHDVASAGPPPVTRDLLEVGHARFETFCAACHGVLGDGASVVATKMALRKPPSFHEPRIAQFQPLAIVNVIDKGFGLMPSYAEALSPRERWAVANYVKALQLARGARVAELSPPLRAELAKEAP